jgi:hypothetical protein
LTLSSYSALEALFSAQLGLLVAFLLAASVRPLQRNRFLLAGILMAITTIKPQVTALAILYFLLWSLHDWRIRGRFCVDFSSLLPFCSKHPSQRCPTGFNPGRTPSSLTATTRPLRS